MNQQLIGALCEIKTKEFMGKAFIVDIAPLPEDFYQFEARVVIQLLKTERRFPIELYRLRIL